MEEFAMKKLSVLLLFVVIMVSIVLLGCSNTNSLPNSSITLSDERSNMPETNKNSDVGNSIKVTESKMEGRITVESVSNESSELFADIPKTDVPPTISSPIKITTDNREEILNNAIKYCEIISNRNESGALTYIFKDGDIIDVKVGSYVAVLEQQEDYYVIYYLGDLALIKKSIVRDLPEDYEISYNDIGKWNNTLNDYHDDFYESLKTKLFDEWSKANGIKVLEVEVKFVDVDEIDDIDWTDIGQVEKEFIVYAKDEKSGHIMKLEYKIGYKLLILSATDNQYEIYFMGDSIFVDKDNIEIVKNAELPENANVSLEWFGLGYFSHS